MNFRVSDQSLFWLLAFFIEDTKIVPNLWLQGVKGSGLDDVLERITVISVQVINDSKSSPVSSLSWIFESCLLEELQSFLKIVLSHVASPLNVQSISLSWLKLLNLLDIFESFIDVTFLEAAPGHVLIDFEVALVAGDCSFIFSHCLIEILLFFVKKTNFDKSVCLSLESKSVGKDRILEIADGLMDLISLGENHSKLVEDLTLLVEVWRHLKDSDQSTDGVVIALELLVQDSDTVPKLWVFDIFKTIESSLISIERFLEVLN